jgi:soluble lytic murein transglycosylase
MKRTTLLLSLGPALLLALALDVDEGRSGGLFPQNPLDSAREELSVGRYWHAARVLREMGAERGGPEEVFLLAEAEAGWRNWAAVVELLDGVEWLDETRDGEGWRLLGRAREEGGRWREAAEAFTRSSDLTPAGADRDAVLGRQARAWAQVGNPVQALDALEALSPSGVVVRSWAALEMAESAALVGDTALVAVLLSRIVEREARSVGWRLLPEARLVAGDSTGAEAAYRFEMGEGPPGKRAEAAIEAGLLTLARGDSVAARGLLLGGLDDGSLRSQARAGAGLLAIGGTDRALSVRLARVFDRYGDGARALRTYDRAAALVADEGGLLPESARLARARLMATVARRQEAALEEFRAIRATTQDPRIGARNLEIWAQLRRRQGRTEAVSTLRRWLVEEYPASPEAAQVVWSRGFNAETGGNIAAAMRHYGEVSRNAPTHTRAGQARMRIGQIRLGQKRLEEAAEVFEAYLADFPNGRRWEEASYWVARTAVQLGDSARARRLVARIQGGSPVSYYAVMGAQLLGEAFEVNLPPGGARVEAGWLTEGLRRLDLLIAAGLHDGAAAEERRLISRAESSRALTLSLAEELIARGRTITGINLGWDLRARDQAWDRRLLEVVFPFPYRELVIREAAEWGVDPILLAALIRQESAFKADIVSHAGAVGLMQVMPTTGQALARAHGPEGFEEANLTTPEVNLHLGAAFFVDMNRRFKDLPIVLSAYNAGPTRATRWRRYPEATDPLRFTERIPFEETRGYVKNVRRNIGLYQALYGER